MDVSIATMAHLDDLVRNNIAMAMETEAKALDPAKVREGTRVALGDPSKGVYLVAVEDGRAIGQLMITREWSDWRNGDIWWVQSVYVTPGRRGSGVLSRLFGHLTGMAREEGAVGLRLYVDKANRMAKRAYEHLGLEQSHYDLYELMYQ